MVVVVVWIVCALTMCEWKTQYIVNGFTQIHAIIYSKHRRKQMSDDNEMGRDARHLQCCTQAFDNIFRIRIALRKYAILLRGHELQRRTMHKYLV